ncbi:unnamed protein product [Cyclocybe aegerita]|uniref:F-box domain-containing protein n=1 Tax=Cyclocybe aegerita TaxID=1973307 RepID=A0A8S0VV78_CYCAE|nr:unnamed protein product [Cyclocybe aegerita]
MSDDAPGPAPAFTLAEPESSSDLNDRTPARQQVLQDDNLLGLVFEHMAIDHRLPDNDVLDASKGLISAAQVCKAFMEPALDWLWEVLPSLIPLLKFLPSFGESDGYYVLEGIRKNDWERFDYHARRVRILDLKPTRIPVMRYLYPYLAQCRSGPLLPALRELRIRNSSSCDISLACIIPTPHLQVIELQNSAIADAHFFSLFFTSVGTEHPNLRSLSLEGERVVDLRPLLQLRDLRKLELRMPNIHLSTTFMEELGCLESLVELTLHAGVITPNIIPEPIRREARPRVAFTSKYAASSPSKIRHLKRLHVLGTLPTIVRILEYMDLRSLTSFVLTESPDPSGTRLDSFWLMSFEHLAASRSLTSIEINQTSDRPNGEEGYSLSAAALEPILGLKALRSMIIDNASFKATDKEMKQFCLAFPHLKSLILPTNPYISSPTFLLVLSQLAMQWVELEKLCISLSVNVDLQDTLDALKREADKMPRTHNHPLRKLRIGVSSAQFSTEQSVQFARFLDRAFPNLEVLTGCGSTQVVDHWGRVTNEPCDPLTLARTIQAGFREARSWWISN